MWRRKRQIGLKSDKARQSHKGRLVSGNERSETMWFYVELAYFGLAFVSAAVGLLIVSVFWD